MNLRTIFKHTTANIMAGNTTIIEGPPGIGKTDMVGKLVTWMKAQHPGQRIGFACCFMATMSPISWTGLPWKNERDYGDGKVWTITDPAIPGWFLATDVDTGEVCPASMFEYGVFVIEEWGQGSVESKRAGAEVIRIGGTPPFFLPVGWARLALTNVDARDGITKEGDFLINRRGRLQATGDVDVWIEDFADKPYMWQGKQWEVLPVTKAWAKQHPDALFDPKPEKQGPWCTARSATSMDRYVQCITAQNGGEIPVNDPGFVEAIEGYIGMGRAVSYVSHLKFQLELPTYEAIVSDPDGTPVPGKGDLQMLMAYTLAGRAKVGDLAQVIKYMTKDSKPKMPRDMMVTFVSSLLRRDYKGMLFADPMQAWLEKNSYMLSVIASLST